MQCNPIVFIHIRLSNFNLTLFLDKMCDQISDAVLDAHLKADPDSKVIKHLLTQKQ